MAEWWDHSYFYLDLFPYITGKDRLSLFRRLTRLFKVLPPGAASDWLPRTPMEGGVSDIEFT